MSGVKEYEMLIAKHVQRSDHLFDDLRSAGLLSWVPCTYIYLTTGHRHCYEKTMGLSRLEISQSPEIRAYGEAWRRKSRLEHAWRCIKWPTELSEGAGFRGEGLVWPQIR